MPYDVLHEPDREHHESGCNLPDIDTAGPGSVFRCDCGRRYQRSNYPSNSWLYLDRVPPTTLTKK